MCSRKWITPFVKQVRQDILQRVDMFIYELKNIFSEFIDECFVTTGVSLNVMSHGITIGYTTDLITELKTYQGISDETASWIASTPELALVFSTFIVPIVIRKLGRRVTNLISAITVTATWFGFVMCSNITTVIILRALKGFALGFTGFLGAVMIGEYTSPGLRGAFLATMSFSIFFGSFLSQVLGTILSWKQAAAVYGALGLTDSILIYLSPETPSFLAFRHKYDECKKVFRWLRGFEEEDELDKMIKVNILNEEKTTLEEQVKGRSLKVNIALVISVVKKKEFHKTLLLMLSLYALNMWSGCIAVSAYANEFYHGIIGPDCNFALMVVTVNLQNMISNILSLALYRYVKRRTILLIGTIVMVVTLFATGLYVYGKTYNFLPFDHPYIGAVLLHIQTCTFVTIIGTFPNVIMGEITPLRYRDICGTISLLFCSANMAMILKTVPFLISTIGLYGTYFLYASITCLSFIQPWIQLPETKDKTLQEIEELIRGEPYIKTDLMYPLSKDLDINGPEC